MSHKRTKNEVNIMILKYYIIGNSDEIKRDRPPLPIIICKVVNVDYKANVCLSDFSVLWCHVVNEWKICLCFKNLAIKNLINSLFLSFVFSALFLQFKFLMRIFSTNNRVQYFCCCFHPITLLLAATFPT